MGPPLQYFSSSTLEGLKEMIYFSVKIFDKVSALHSPPNSQYTYSRTFLNKNIFVADLAHDVGNEGRYNLQLGHSSISAEKSV